MVSHNGVDGIVLSDTKIRQAKAKSTAYQLTDERGLYLLVKPTGGKLWRWNYRNKGVQKTMSFGQYPDVPLVAARERHAEARKILAAGVDPMEKRKADRAELMVSDMRTSTSNYNLHMPHGASDDCKDGIKTDLALAVSLICQFRS